MDRSAQNRFFEWLAKSVTAAQLSALYQAFNDLEDTLSKQTALFPARCPLCEITDIVTLEALHRALCADPSFQRSPHADIMLSVLQYYTQYVRECLNNSNVLNTSNRSNAKSPTSIETADALVERLRRDGIPFTDHRDKGGCLWVASSAKTAALIMDFRKRGVTFSFLNEKKQWWTKDRVPLASDASRRESLPSERADDENASANLNEDAGQAAQEKAKDIDRVMEDHENSTEFAATVFDRLSETAEKAPVPAGYRNTEIDLVNWLHANQPSLSTAMLIGTLRGSERFAVKHYLSGMRIFGVPAQEARKAVQNLLAYPEFAKTDLYPNFKRFSSLFLEFLHAVEETDSENAAPIQPPPPAKKAQPACPQMEPALVQMLQGESFGILRRALLAEGITTAEAFDRLNIWIFMNQHDLYSSVKQRFAVFRALQTRKPKAAPPAEEHASAQAEMPVHAEHKPESEESSRFTWPPVSSPKPKPAQEEEKPFEFVWPPASPTKPRPAPEPAAQSPVSDSQNAQIEQAILSADVQGMTLEALEQRFPNITATALRQYCSNSPDIVEFASDIFVHINAFVELDEFAAKLQEIIEKLLNRNKGYVSATQLYEHTHTELSMFLNDNALDDEHSVYALARHLFQKMGWHGYRYAFSSGAHISRIGDASVSSMLDIIRQYARGENGFFSYDALEAHLSRAGFKTNNLRGQMKLGAEPFFFYYTSEELVSAEALHIDDNWLERVRHALSRLFADVGDHVVLRSIRDIWFEQLPALPGNRPWTPLLLQYVLRFYGDTLGARTIQAMASQNLSVTHCMLVKADSGVQSFADAVMLYLLDNGIEQRRFQAEELRHILVEGGLLAGNELTGNMPKALGGNPLFAWDFAGKQVTIHDGIGV